MRLEKLLVEADQGVCGPSPDSSRRGGAGRLGAHVDATFPLAEAAKAHALGETDRTTGKIVLTVR
ncbi:zinc-binding dehydrogenase [Streptomyces sp. 11x1]|uniref:zinc-binding dehydrogenase n=1 Tax=Streptomyces sp. 11x1 TaxID=3038642 RepID=UPI0037D99570